MKTRCPACGATCSLDALLGHSDASKAFVSALSVTGDLQHPLIKYLAMFRSDSRDLTFERTAKLISDIAPDIVAKEIKRGHHTYPAPRAAWVWAIATMMERREQGKLQLPLKNHGYLYEVITSFKPEYVPAQDATPRHGLPRPKTESERAVDQAEHERQKHAKPAANFSEMMAFTQMNTRQPERGLKNIPNDQLMAHVSKNKRPDETLEQCYQRLKTAETSTEENI